MRFTYRTPYGVLYRLGITPWDTTAIPAPLMAAIEGPAALSPGTAVDLGCGTGRQAEYLAAHGWTVTGIDGAPQALSAARKRASDRVQWRLADVTDVRAVDPDGRLAGTADLLLDNGCLHGIPTQRRRGWASTVNALAAPGAVLLVHAVACGVLRGIGPIGADADEVAGLLGDGWQPQPSQAPDWHRYLRR